MRTVVAACVIAASAFFGPPVWADLFDPTHLDQRQDAMGLCYGTGGETWMAQTFKADKTGVLEGIEIGSAGFAWAGDNAPLVQIRNVNTEVEENPPGSTIWGQVTLDAPVSSVPYAWTPISFLDKNIDITAGDMYSIVLWARDPDFDSGNVSVGAAVDPASYLDGALWAGNNGSDWLLLSSTGIGDMQFRTYVVPVPLPAGVWLGILGLSYAGWRLKRQMA